MPGLSLGGMRWWRVVWGVEWVCVVTFGCSGLGRAYGVSACMVFPTVRSVVLGVGLDGLWVIVFRSLVDRTPYARW